MVAYLRIHAQDTTHLAAWTLQTAAATESPASIVESESFTAISPLFERSIQVSDGEPALLSPVSTSAREYFARHDVHLRLGEELPALPGHQSTLNMRIPARGLGFLATRTCTLSAPLPPYPRTPEARENLAHLAHLDPAQSWWIRGGYVTPFAPDARAALPVLLTTWADQRPELALSLRTWFELRFRADHTYLLTTVSEPASEGTIPRLIDFGPISEPDGVQ
jgi:hypothetical protein